jgi:hypothetical protein
MGVRDINIERTAQTPRKILIVPIVTAISQTGVVFWKFTPGYAFRITKIRSFARTVTGTITSVVKVSTRTAMAAAAPVAATDTNHTLSTTAANLRGSATDAITLELTTDGSGAATNLAYHIEIRPLGLAKDQGVAD